MAALNNCMFIGNIGKIETRYLPNGDAVTNFTVAVNESWKSKEGEKQQRTTWVQCVSYRKLAEIIAEYCKTGSSIYVSGKLNISSWEKDGVKHYKTDIIVNELQMLGGKQENRDNGTSQPVAPPQRQQRATSIISMTTFLSLSRAVIIHFGG